MEKTCTFFGHRDCPFSIVLSLKAAIEELITKENVVNFYVGDSGNFDTCCRLVLKDIGAKYSVVLSRMPTKKTCEDFSDTILPEEIVNGGPQRFGIERRNRWMLKKSDYVICYLRPQEFGGTAKFVGIAKRKNKKVINLFRE